MRFRLIYDVTITDLERLEHRGQALMRQREHFDEKALPPVYYASELLQSNESPCDVGLHIDDFNYEALVEEDE